MNQEIVEMLSLLYKFEVVKALYDQRIITQENYKEYLMTIAKGVIITEGGTENGATQTGE